MILFGSFAAEASIQRFRNEVLATASLRYPNIVAIHEAGEHDGQPYFSMDYVEGQSLAQVTSDLRFAISSGQQAGWSRLPKQSNTHTSAASYIEISSPLIPKLCSCQPSVSSCSTAAITRATDKSVNAFSSFIINTFCPCGRHTASTDSPHKTTVGKPTAAARCVMPESCPIKAEQVANRCASSVSGRFLAGSTRDFGNSFVNRSI